ncbi:hypothetical protein M951_chr1130 (nucleomorph) [Lotharella oceanica]|uniref:Uncharacterized protein n=1 Tax=Lotharella oceanica TaxID=641309 RepID=A0A060D6K1_9EUKA|nr:hypothetical protein M951_chr1130 [Lotharella oceanica]
MFNLEFSNSFSTDVVIFVLITNFRNSSIVFFSFLLLLSLLSSGVCTSGICVFSNLYMGLSEYRQIWMSLPKTSLFFSRWSVGSIHVLYIVVYIFNHLYSISQPNLQENRGTYYLHRTN